MNPPLCPSCGLPVEGSAANEPGTVWHGECYRDEMTKLGLLTAGAISAYSHDDRVRDGLEYP